MEVVSGGGSLQGAAVTVSPVLPALRAPVSPGRLWSAPCGVRRPGCPPSGPGPPDTAAVTPPPGLHRRIQHGCGGEGLNQPVYIQRVCFGCRYACIPISLFRPIVCHSKTMHGRWSRYCVFAA